jgi:hypothetical protein
MNLSTWSLNTDSKRWLAVLAAAGLVSVVMLARAFMNVLAPAEENTVAVQGPAVAATKEVQTRSEPVWNGAQQTATTENHEATVVRVSPFDGKNKLQTKRDEEVAQQADVHRQADYLRGLIAAGKLPAGYGPLTKEQIDDMEKKGITIQ